MFTGGNQAGGGGGGGRTAIVHWLENHFTGEYLLHGGYGWVILSQKTILKCVDLKQYDHKLYNILDYIKRGA